MTTKIKKTVKKYNENFYEVAIVKVETDETVLGYGKTEEAATKDALEKITVLNE